MNAINENKERNVEELLRINRITWPWEAAIDMIDIDMDDDAMRWTPDGTDDDTCGCGHTHDNPGCPDRTQPCGDYRCCQP